MQSESGDLTPPDEEIAGPVGPPGAQLDYGAGAPAQEPAPDEPATGESGRQGRFAELSTTAWIAFALAAVIAIALFWIGGELHYQSCLTAANARTQGANDSLSRLVRTREINGCSHSPF
jgi:hypothetical protein